MRPIDADALALETKRWFVIPDNRETMKAAIDHAETLDYVPRQQWISVEDRLPGDLVDVLVWFEYFRFGSYNCLYKTIGVGSVYNGKWSFINGSSGWQQLKVIAWMPLPEPPKEE